MSEIRNRRQAANGHKKPNGLSNGHSKQLKAAQSSPAPSTAYQQDEDEILVKKKLQMLQEDQTVNNNNDNNNNDSRNEEEQFADTFTMGAHAKLTHDEPIIFDGANTRTSIGHSARDQMAAALLRLQAQLDTSSQRLAAVETKLENLTRRHMQQSRESSMKQSGAKGLLSRDNLTNLAYLTWPILVFVAMRAIERRAAAKKLALS